MTLQTNVIEDFLRWNRSDVRRIFDRYRNSISWKEKHILIYKIHWAFSQLNYNTIVFVSLRKVFGDRVNTMFMGLDKEEGGRTPTWDQQMEKSLTFEQMSGSIETLRRQFVISKRSKQLRHNQIGFGRRRPFAHIFKYDFDIGVYPSRLSEIFQTEIFRIVDLI